MDLKQLKLLKMSEMTQIHPLTSLSFLFMCVREDKRPDRRVAYCLICKKPFEMLSTHLRNKCMKHSTQEERDQS